MARRPKPPVDLKDPKNAMIVKLADQVRAEVRKRYGSNLTYEQRRDAGAKVMAEVLWADGEKDLYERAVDEYRRLKSVIKPVDLPDDVRRDMDAVVARADKALCP